MIRTRVLLLLGIGLAAGPVFLSAQSIAFTVSIPRPATRTIHVAMRCEGLRGEFTDFKMPAWMPGYYRLLDYAKNVANFSAVDGGGRALPWEKTARNTWRVAAANASAIVLEYDVSATTRFAAQNFVDETRAYLAPTGLFLYPAGRIQQPVTVTVEPPPGWATMATGLDRLAAAHTYSASDFDVLFDAPILIGNQELLRFEVGAIPHTVAMENVPASVDRARITADLQRMVEAAARLIGDIPYKHYTFLMMGQGNGGIEHLNSASIAFNGNGLTTPEGYRGWLSYVAHEYFHHYNVKRIRPIALGPFDYDRENLTNMLWVSEGLSVYYQDIVCLRAGLITRQQYLDKLRNSITRFENAPGHRYQSAVESSQYTWGNSGVGTDRNTSISYYDNGAMLGGMLDLAIRHSTRNRKSLDDVMRSLYQTYYRGKKRGFTDAEFRAECESAAGGSLADIFEYAAIPKEMDYGKYLAYAGLEIEAAATEGKGAYLGVNVQQRESGLVVVDVNANSPAQKAGLRVGDQVIEVEGAKAAVKALSDAILAKKPGDRLKLKLARGEVEAELVLTPQWSYTIRPMASPDALQVSILNDWLRGGTP